MPASDARPRWASRPTRIREDRRFVTGRGRYVADITPPGTLHVGLVTSPHAHARIVSIDPAEALEVDGVACVLTGAELAKRGAEPARVRRDEVRQPDDPHMATLAGRVRPSTAQ